MSFINPNLNSCFNKHFYAKSSAKTGTLKIDPAKRHCQNQHPDLAKQPSMASFGVSRKRKILSDTEKLKLADSAGKWVSKEGLALNAPSKSGFLQFLESLHTNVYGYDNESFRAVKAQISRAKVVESLERSEEKVKAEILKHKDKCVKNGQFFLLVDHWECSKGSYEASNSYHGIILGARGGNGASEFYPLRFTSADLKTSAVIREEFDETLKVF